MLNPVYFDHNATTPFHPDLARHLTQWMEAWGNPSSIHWAGRGPKTLLREARLQVAQLLNVEPLELVWTSGGSEANNLALKGVCLRHPSPKGRDEIVISAVEHPSVLRTAEALRAFGYKLHVIPVPNGQFDMESFANALNERTALVSVMFANNETGSLFPIEEITRQAHAVGALVHCDAVQGLGKTTLDLRALGVDLASISGHKFYALKGCGALYVRRGVQLVNLIDGGGQERGRRAGTENLLAYASLGFMAAKGDQIAAHVARMGQLRDRLEARLLAEIDGVHLTGAVGPRLSNTSSLILDGVDGETLLMNMDVRGFAVSTGAACSSGSPEPSPTLLAMGLSRRQAQSSLRLSLGWGTTAEECDLFFDALSSVIARLRGFRHGEQFVCSV